ncbi:hypothetical protein [Paraburkholderia sp. D1E]|uniref:hypothetical protein n=1 Tax=Paraburkholderia sp. D1E TaxID=3461398 RepID=UPI004046095C
MRYLIELAARTQRRTVSSFLEWAAEQAVNACVIERRQASIDSHGNKTYLDLTLGEAADVFWDVDEADRLVKLALQLPSLLTFDEQVVWKRIREDADVWKKGDKLDFPLMRSRWATYVDGASDATEE